MAGQSGEAATEQGGQGPILLLGMPRSGTTWLGKILGSHPDTLYRHEPDSHGRMNFLPMAPDSDQAGDFSDEVRDFVARVPELRAAKTAATVPAFPKRYLGSLPSAWNMAARWGAKVWSRFWGETRVPLWLPPEAMAQSRLVIKSIESLNRAGLLARALPEARVVILVRHPFGFIASMLRGKRSGQFGDSASIGEDRRLLEVLAGSDAGQRFGLSSEAIQDMTPEQRLAWQWVLSNDKAMNDTESMANVMLVRYEDLCADPVAESRKVFDHCDLDLESQTRDFLARSTGTHRGRYYSVYKDPQQAAWAWQDELGADTRACTAPILQRSRAAGLFGGDLI